jgi:hypothetical protein
MVKEEEVKPNCDEAGTRWAVGKTSIPIIITLKIALIDTDPWL